MTAPRRASGSGRATVAETRGQADYHHPPTGASPQPAGSARAAPRAGAPGSTQGRLDRPNRHTVNSPVLSDAYRPESRHGHQAPLPAQQPQPQARPRLPAPPDTRPRPPDNSPPPTPDNRRGR